MLMNVYLAERPNFVWVIDVVVKDFCLFFLVRVIKVWETVVGIKHFLPVREQNQVVWIQYKKVWVKNLHSSVGFA
jgi:hypothetical protein